MSNEAFRQREEEDEALPEKLDTIFEVEADKNKIRELGGRRLDVAACIDMGTGKMYVGESHSVLLRKYPIPQERYCKAIIEFRDGEILIPHLFDYRPNRPKEIMTHPLRNLITASIQQELAQGKS